MKKISENYSEYVDWTPERYLHDRLDKQQCYYCKKSSKYQKRYKFWRIIQLIISSAIPVIAIIPQISSENIKALVVILGTIVTAITTYLSLEKYHDLWIKYRTVSELLKREKMFYLTESNIYHDKEKNFHLLVERTENILSSENNQWALLIKDTPKQSQKTPTISS